MLLAETQTLIAAREQALEAEKRLAGQVHRTPVMTSRTLDERLGARIFFKCENFQRTGAFKFRGALNALLALSPAERAAGVVTHSSGNHAQALALGGRMLGVGVTAVMPCDAPAVKRAAAESYGAKIVTYRRGEVRREEVSDHIRREQGAILISPFDDPRVIAGQSTVLLELLDQVEGLDLVLVPCGGGGLLAGCAVAARERCPACRVVGVEPEGADDAARSFRTGVLHRAQDPTSIADGLLAESMGRYTFPLVRELVHDIVTVPDSAILQALRACFRRLKLVVEPSGAIGLAALCAGRVPVRPRIGVILSGGNLDPGTLARHLASAA